MEEFLRDSNCRTYEPIHFLTDCIYPKILGYSSKYLCGVNQEYKLKTLQSMEPKKEINIVETTKGKFDTTGISWIDRQFSHPERTIRIATSFSGISAPDMALKRFGLKTKIVFASDIGERYLNYNFKQLRNFAKELDEKYWDAFAETLYEGNKANVEYKNTKRMVKGKDEVPFTKKFVYDCLFNRCDDIIGQYELVKGCLDIILENKGITERRAIEDYICSLYDEKGINYVKEAFFANYDIDEDDWHTDIRFMDATPYKGQVDLYVGGSPCQSYSRSGKRLCLEDTRGLLFYDFAVRIKECEPKVFIYENVSDMVRAEDGMISGLEAALSVFKDLGYHIYWKVLDAQNYGVPQHRERVWVVGFKDETEFRYPNPIPLKQCLYDYLDKDILPRCGRTETISERELTGTEYLRLMGFRDFNVPESIQKLGSEKATDKLRFMAGNSMVVECLMALFLQMDITKFGVDTDEDVKLKSTLYDYSDKELDELVAKIKSFREYSHPSKRVDFSYLQSGLLPCQSDDIIKVGAHKKPKGGNGVDSQWDRVHSVRGMCPCLTKTGKVYIIVSNEVHNVEPKKKWIPPTQRVLAPLW